MEIIKHNRVIPKEFRETSVYSVLPVLPRL